MGHELVVLADKIDWAWLDAELAESFSDRGRPAEPVHFMLGMFLPKHTYGLSDEQVWDRWVFDPYFQYFTGEEFFQHELPHERSGMSHWRKRIGDKLDILLAEALQGLQIGAKARRPAIEAVIGHRKTDGHLDRNFLKGRLGDQINAVMSVVGYNLRLILGWLKHLLAQNPG